MSDIATLDISVDSSEVRTGTKDISALKQASGLAEKATGAMARAFQNLDSNAQVAGSAAEKVKSSLVNLDEQMNTNARSLEAVKKNSSEVGSTLIDIGMKIAGGGSPFEIAFNQGIKLSQLLGGGGLRGAVVGLGEALLNMLSPANLVIGGLTAGAAAIIQYFMTAKDNTANVDSLLRRHGETVAALKDKYGEAAKGVREYAEQSDAVQIRNTRDNLKDAYESLNSVAFRVASQAAPVLTAYASEFKDVPDIARKFQRAFIDLNASIKAGTPDLLSFQTTMSEISNDESVPEALREIAHRVSELDENTLRVAKSIPGMLDSLKLLGTTAGNQVDGVSSLSEALRTLAGISAPQVTVDDQISSIVNEGMNRLQLQARGGVIDEEARRRLLLAGQQAQQRYDSQFVAMGDGTRVVAPVPESRPNIEMEGLERRDFGSGAYKRASVVGGDTDAYQNELRSIVDRTSAIKAETAAQTNLNPTVNDYGNAQAKAKTATDLLAAAERQKLAITPALNGQINETAAAYANAVAEQNRQTEATKRAQEAMSFAKDLTKGFISDLKSGLKNGESFWKSFSTAAVNALNKIADKLLNDVLDSLFKVNSAASGGGGGGGGFLSSLLGIFGFGGGSSGGKFDLATGANAPIPIPRPTFANGGYTGSGGKNDPAGIVHAGEVVWSQKDIARAGGVGVVEAMRLGRRGYADGGVVGEGGPQLLRAQPDAAVPVRRLRADNQNDASGSASGVHVTVGVSVDEDGNLKAYVKNVAQSEAQSSTRQGLNDFNQQLPDRVAQINRNPRRR